MLSTALRVADALPGNWKRHAADHDPDNGENRALRAEFEKKQNSTLKL